MMQATDIFICSQWQRFMQNIYLMHTRNHEHQRRSVTMCSHIVHEIKGAAVHCELAGKEGADDLLFVARFADFILTQNTQAKPALKK